MRRPLLLAAIVASAALSTGPVRAHTDSDHVAVPAGGTSTITLRPTHGCGESPTVEVSIRAPVAGAKAGDVDGWTASAASDGQGRTVLTWAGGSLPADRAGAFPVTFTVPDAVGELLTFPSVQSCANGEELAWISGDPDDEFPAPRVLVLAAGSEAATTIDDLPADVPGRDKLSAIVDADNPSEASTTTTSARPRSTTSTAEPPEATEETGVSPALPIALLVTFGGAGTAIAVSRRRRAD